MNRDKYYDPAVLERGRAQSRKGAFQRRIVERTPRDVWFDHAKLECGHQGPVLSRHTGDKDTCYDCMEAWLDEEQAKKALAAPEREQ